jgi:hypothetical protein
MYLVCGRLKVFDDTDPDALARAVVGAPAAYFGPARCSRWLLQQRIRRAHSSEECAHSRAHALDVSPRGVAMLAPLASPHLRCASRKRVFLCSGVHELHAHRQPAGPVLVRPQGNQTSSGMGTGAYRHRHCWLCVNAWLCWWGLQCPLRGRPTCVTVCDLHLLCGLSACMCCAFATPSGAHDPYCWVQLSGTVAPPVSSQPPCLRACQAVADSQTNTPRAPAHATAATASPSPIPPRLVHAPPCERTAMSGYGNLGRGLSSPLSLALPRPIPLPVAVPHPPTPFPIPLPTPTPFPIPLPTPSPSPNLCALQVLDCPRCLAQVHGHRRHQSSGGCRVRAVWQHQAAAVMSPAP